MRRFFSWLVLVGGAIVVLAVLWQSFTIAAYARGAGEGALDAHGFGSLFVHIGQLAIVIGALVAFWRSWKVVALTLGFLVLAFVQLIALGNNENPGGWVNGLHGMLALVILLAGLAYAVKAARELGLAGRPALPDVPDA
jgi:hypothetical protein